MTPARGAALRRVPLLVLGFASLAVGIAAGLARLGWNVSASASAAVPLHGPLLICGFFGVVISLERAVAIQRAWPYLGPALAGAGGVLAIAGATVPAAWLFAGGALVLSLASADIVRRQPALFTITMALGALCWLAGTLTWALGSPVYDVVAWWLAFPVLTIAGERLELSRFMPPSPNAKRLFVAILLLFAAGLLGASTPLGVPVFGCALLALALWLARNDIARRTVRARGVTRFIAVCLLCGYAWLAVAGAVIATSGLAPGSPLRDVALHALLLGFVFSMVLGHAPIIVPAVARVAVPYSAAFYGPLVLLHVSLAVRAAGDVIGLAAWARMGGALNALALAAFVAGTLVAVLRGKATKSRGAGLSSP